MAESQDDNTCETSQSNLPHIVNLEDIHWSWLVTQESLNAVKEFEIRDDDVWVVTYPKSGTHWVSEIVQLVNAKGNLETIDREQFPMPIEFVHFQPGRPVPVDDKRRVPNYKRVMSWKSPRTVVTHIHEKFIPKQIREGKGKVIYVTRNPKDTAVSYWHFVTPTGKDSPGYYQEYTEWDDFYRMFCDGTVAYDSWFSHNLNFWEKHRHDKNFLFLKYEDMKKDLRGAVVQIADFLGHSLSDDIIGLVVEHSTHKSMKQRFHTGARSNTSESSAKKIGATYLMRKGIVGDWKAQFTVAQNEAFDKLYRKEMEGSTLQVEFELL